MSIRVEIDIIPYEKREKINKELEIKIVPKYGNVQPKYLFPYEIDNDFIKLPFAYSISELELKRPSRESLPSRNFSFNATTRPEQKEILKEAKIQLNKTGSTMISAYTGFGKSISSISLACSIKFKTLIIVNKIVLIKQWEESILQFCDNVTVQKLKPKCKKEDCDFYIINAQNIEKMGKNFFSDIGAVIVDEAHLIMAESLSRSLQFVYPRYLIGLTATPYRPDGLNILLDLYFGKHKIIRKLHREHIAYKVTTNFKPTIEYTMTGTINWGIVLDSQANDEDRNELIIKILQYFKDRNFLVITKRISQGEYLLQRLEEEKEDVTSLLGSNQEFDKDSRILIGTSQKVGVGFDHKRLDALLLAADVEEYFIQYLGRVFRTKEVVPIVVDLVDNYSVLNKHWLTRRKVYQDCGGTIKNFDLKLIT